MGYYASKCGRKRLNDEKQHTRAAPDEPALLFSLSREKKQEDAIHPKEGRVLQGFHRGEEKTTVMNICYLDNGASNHMTGHREMFQQLDENITGKVRLGDGSDIQIMGKGSAVFQCKNRDQYTFLEVYYIPKLCTNIISFGQMTENGIKVNMMGEAMKVYDNGKLLMLVKRISNRLYKISLELAKSVCLLVTFEEPYIVTVSGSSKTDVADPESVTSVGHSSPTAEETSPSIPSRWIWHKRYDVFFLLGPLILVVSDLGVVDGEMGV
ncbi:hypothetical protein AKJ16_DCAP22420 [Drosera capensis]